MNFTYAFAPRPVSGEVLKVVDEAAGRLYDKVRRLDVDAMDISDYVKRYFGRFRRNLDNVMQRYSHLLALSLREAPADLSSWVFLDYGAGPGLLACLAKEAGVGHVLYNDIYDIACADAAVIAKALATPADAYILGDIDDVTAWCRGRDISVDAVANWDVLEHVYDTEGFLKKLPQLSRGALTVAMASSANAMNPLFRRKIMRQQRRMELLDRPRQTGDKLRDEWRSYQTVRREMIAAQGPTLARQEVVELARRTRGMKARDIGSCVEAFMRTRQYPPLPDHPTNTCDPATGNWCERLMDPAWIRSIMEKSGFQAAILPGYYGRFNRPVLRLAGYALNMGIRAAGPMGLRFALYYTLYATLPAERTVG